MAKLTMKMIDELEQLVIEKLRLELKRCDLRDKQPTTAELRSIHERMRTLSRTTFEIWIELIPLLRQELRIKRLRGSDREKARLKVESDMEELAAKWTARTAVPEKADKLSKPIRPYCHDASG